MIVFVVLVSLRLRPHQDLVPMPGHCALAPKEMLFTHCGAQNHFLAVYIYDSNHFVDHFVDRLCNFKSQGNMGNKKHGTDGILCRQVPVAGA